MKVNEKLMNWNVDQEPWRVKTETL